jgi:hypothetical protein
MMSGTATPHTWVPRMARRIQRPQGAMRARSASSSGLPLAPPKASPCVLDLLGHVRPQAHAATEPNI